MFLSAAGAAAAFGLGRHITFIDAALAQSAPEAGKGFKHYKVGDIQMTSLYDGIVDRKNAAGFIKNASADDVAKALTAGGLATDNIPNIFTVPIARVGGRTILFDAGTGGQLGPTTGLMADNMKAAGIDPVYFGVMFIMNNAIGLITPPVGIVLNVICGVSKISMKDLMKGLWPFLWAELIVLFLLVLFPSLVMVPLKWFS